MKLRAGQLGPVAAALALVCCVPAAAAHTDRALDCSPQRTRTAVTSFVAAFNGGDTGRLDALFARAPLFRWYSSNAPGLRRVPSAGDRDTLIAYFHRRHAERDRIRLVRFTFTGSVGSLGNFTLELRRSAADYREGRWLGLIGKGAAVCPEESAPRAQLVVLSLGGPGSNRSR